MANIMANILANILATNIIILEALRDGQMWSPDDIPREVKRKSGGKIRISKANALVALHRLEATKLVQVARLVPGSRGKLRALFTLTMEGRLLAEGCRETLTEFYDLLCPKVEHETEIVSPQPSLH